MIERLLPSSIPMRDFDRDAAEALSAFHAAADVETQQYCAYDYVSDATHAEVDRLFMVEGKRTDTEVLPYLRPLQAKIHAAIQEAVRSQDRWIERCFFGRFHHLAKHIHPAGRA